MKEPLSSRTFAYNLVILCQRDGISLHGLRAFGAHNAFALLVVFVPVCLLQVDRRIRVRFAASKIVLCNPKFFYITRSGIRLVYKNDGVPL